ncbi:MAG: hypothetical protein QM728_08350 [Gordonia sp. (in: high G+C Gram-positive bacteria)]|uniref:hypothetical protein n=1 Tax=Gordonia sp. (in: high G+C Gram-positive bacteria) TaxID=84139 RepID=UPI0039E48617
MNTRMTRKGAGAAALAVALAVVGCGAQDDSAHATPPLIGGPGVIAPVTLSIGDLPGRTVDLRARQVLNINVPDADVTAYRGRVADRRIASFTPGRALPAAQGGARFNPGVKALARGRTAVTLTKPGRAPVRFVVRVH